MIPKKIVQYTMNGQEVRRYDSIREAQEELKITHVSSVCRRKRKSDGGYLWRYQDENMVE